MTASLIKIKFIFTLLFFYLCEDRCVPLYESSDLVIIENLTQFYLCEMPECPRLLIFHGTGHIHGFENHLLCRFTRSSGCLSFPGTLLHNGWLPVSQRYHSEEKNSMKQATVICPTEKAAHSVHFSYVAQISCNVALICQQDGRADGICYGSLIPRFVMEKQLTCFHR